MTATDANRFEQFQKLESHLRQATNLSRVLMDAIGEQDLSADKSAREALRELAGMIHDNAKSSLSMLDNI